MSWRATTIRLKLTPLRATRCRTKDEKQRGIAVRVTSDEVTQNDLAHASLLFQIKVSLKMHSILL